MADFGIDPEAAIAMALSGATTGSSPFGFGGGGSATDWNKIASLLGNFGGQAGKGAASDASFDKRGGEGPGPYQTATQGLSNLLATLIQMHRQAMLTQPVQAPRVSLLG